MHCLCQLLNCKKNNGRNVVLCSSMGNSPKLVSFLLNCVYILHHNDQVNVLFASPSIAIKTMVETLYGAPQWEIPQAWFLSCSIVSRYSSQGEDWEECFLFQLLNCKKNNGRDALWFSSMGDSPSLVSFLLNCVQILKIGGRLGRMLPLLAPKFQEKQWYRCSMVLLNGKFPKLGLSLAHCVST